MTNPLLAVRAVTNRQGHGRLGPVTRRAFYARATAVTVRAVRLEFVHPVEGPLVKDRSGG